MCARAKRSGVSRSHEGRRQSSRTWVFLVGLDSPPPWGGRVVLQMGPPVWGGGVPSGSEVIFDLPFSPICPPPIPSALLWKRSSIRPPLAPPRARPASRPRRCTWLRTRTSQSCEARGEEPCSGPGGAPGASRVRSELPSVTPARARCSRRAGRSPGSSSARGAPSDLQGF